MGMVFWWNVDILFENNIEASYDFSLVEKMSRLSKHFAAPKHIYPQSLTCYDIMPPRAGLDRRAENATVPGSMVQKFLF